MIPKIVKGHICFSHNNLLQIETLFPEYKRAEIQGETIYAVPATLDAARVLRNIGVEAPSPIRSEYDWPIRPDWKPRASQIATAEFFTLNPRGYCHSSMRVGKTMATLWAIDYLQRVGLVQRALIIGPLSSLELAWADNIFINFPRKKYAVLHGSADSRRRLLAQRPDIAIINHDGIEVLLTELLADKDINCVVLDEAHEYKTSTTKKWKALNKLITNLPANSWVWGLTGTPTPQSPVDAYGQAKLIRPEACRSTFTAFKNETMQQFGPFRWVPRAGSEAIVKKVLSPSIRFERSEVTDIEPCLIERHAELSPDQAKHVNALIRNAVTEVDGSAVTAVNAAVLVSKITQACCGVLYGTDGEFLRIDFGPRLKVLEELIENNAPDKCLVFVPFTGALNAIAGELRKRWSVEIVDGSVGISKRNQIFSDFQKTPNPHIIVAHPQTMSYSLSLTAASLVIWYAPPAGGNKIYQQACARIDGSEQKNKMDIAHISSCKVERHAFSVVQGKGKYQDVILDMMRGKR